jgi:zinc protease
MNEILFGGRSSRMYGELVHEMEIASEVRGSLTPFHDPGLYEVWVSMRPNHAASSALRVVDREFRRAARESVTEEELEKARNRLELSFLEGMETASGKAEQIGFHETVLGDASTIFPRLETYRRVTGKDICEAAQRYLLPSRRSVITVLSETKKRRDQSAKKAAQLHDEA